MTVAEETRATVRERPFLHDALRAGVVNYAAAAAALDIDADRDAVATALRRFANDLDEGEASTGVSDPGARVRMERGVGAVDDDATADEGTKALLTVGAADYAVGAGDATAVVASGDVGPRALERVLGRLRIAAVGVDAAGVTPTGLVVIVGGQAGADALRAVESALSGAYHNAQRV
jgi:hypothetical protein